MGKDIATLTLDTFSDLRGIIGVSNSSLKVLGKDNVNDGFGGVFYWDPTSSNADDNLNIIQKTGVTIGRWVRLSESETDSNIGSKDLVLTDNRVLSGNDTKDLSIIHVNNLTFGANSFSFQNTSNNTFTYQGQNGFIYTIKSDNITNVRNYQYPDNSGIIALESYVDNTIANTPKIFPLTSNNIGVISDNSINGKNVLKLEKSGFPPYYKSIHFTKSGNTINMISPNTLSNNTEYLITIE